MRNFISRAVFICAYLILYLVMRGSHRTRVAVCYEDKVLLVKTRLARGQWALPGGGIKRGELPSLAAVRELREELGLELRADNLKYLKSINVSSGGISMHFSVFFASISEQIAIRKNTVELRDARWFTFGEAATLPMNSAENQALQQIESARK